MPTPTPVAFGTPQFNIPIDGAALGQTFASGAVQAWNIFNDQAFADVVWVILLVLFVIIGFMSIRSRLENL